jgi:hypothetical protein
MNETLIKSVKSSMKENNKFLENKVYLCNKDNIHGLLK